MPLPWKKVKSTRISQLVNDHLHKSQKRRDGSSLVVETGFPTSLIDLFMKNREKLKKPSKKKRHSPPIPPLLGANDPLISGSPTSFPSHSPSPSPVIAVPPTTPVHSLSPFRCPSPEQSPSLLPLSSSLPSEGLNEIVVVGSSDRTTCVGADERERCVDANRVLLAVLKTFLVVVLALGTKRLTVGITISAFLLFFLDYVGKYASRFLVPCSESKGVLLSILQRFRRLLRSKEVKLDEKNGRLSIPELQQDHSSKPGCSSLKNTESICSDQEIQIVEPKGCLMTCLHEIQPVDEIMDEPCSNGRLGCQVIEKMEVLIEREESMSEVAELKRKSRRARIKSKMKKLVPKKLRSSRKERNPQNLDILKKDGVFLCNQQEVDEDELEIASTLSSITSERYKEEDTMNSICTFDRSYEVVQEASRKREEKGQETEPRLTWRHLVLCLIVLIGLIGGRAFALLLTLSWCLLLKLGEKLPTYKRMRIVRSFKDKSGYNFRCAG
ncbi:hypothetical protein CDL12_29208 [Handroanthus impetiginosus]|uniref:Uncharacterized protein n=1 Tax=Handroanthus impetiginosus TaxID=429701 RepID=A0A2G9FZ20_9LAMI|nr:hypothetical protein CDL12_29208 [Handroanthus impetiginosus]